MTVDSAWAELVRQKIPLLEEALRYSGGTHSIEDVLKGAVERRYTIWPGIDSVIVTEIIDYPQTRVCHCFLAAGKLEELAEMRKWIEHWAKLQGCKLATINGRKGWERVLKPAGYRHVATVLEKELK